MPNTKTPGLVLKLSTEPGAPVQVDGKTLWRKELIYDDEFHAEAGDVSYEFGVQPELREHWESVFELMKTNGVDVPLQDSHAAHPEKTYGKINRCAQEKDSKGRDALFGYFETPLPDDEAKKLFGSNNVSIYVPPSFTDGKKNTYYRPIRHVALTPYPVIPGLDGFQQIAASNEPKKPPPKETKKMATEALTKLATDLGVKYDENADDAAIVDAIKKYVDGLKEKKPDGEGEKKPPAIAASFVRMAKENRQAKIDKLVDEGRVAPAAAKELAKQYVTDDAVTLALSHETEVVKDPDGFNGVILALSQNTAFKTGLRSGPQVLGDFKKGDGDESPTVRDAKRRAEKAKK